MDDAFLNNGRLSEHTELDDGSRSTYRDTEVDSVGEESESNPTDGVSDRKLMGGGMGLAVVRETFL
jgi:hypothetical protein